MDNMSNYRAAVVCAVIGFDGENLNILLDGEGRMPRRMLCGEEEPDRCASELAAAIVGGDPLAMRQLRTIVADGECLILYVRLLRLSLKVRDSVRRKGCRWALPGNAAQADGRLCLTALGDLVENLSATAAAFDLLPRKFTIHNLQRLYESALGRGLDNRNFRKKIIASGYILPTGEKQRAVAHKPATYYIFDRASFQRNDNHRSRLDFTRCGK